MRIACPTCKAVIEDAPDDYAPRPFCSARCKLVDLHAWLTEGRRISSPIGMSDLGDDAEVSGGTSSLPTGKHR